LLTFSGNPEEAGKLMGNADAYTGAFYDKIEENKRKKE